MIVRIAISINNNNTTLVTDSAWAEEFAEFTNSDLNNHVDSNNETYKQDFWRKLEDEWKVGVLSICLF